MVLQTDSRGISIGKQRDGIYISGYTSGILGGVSAGSIDAFVVKYEQ